MGQSRHVFGVAVVTFHVILTLLKTIFGKIKIVSLKPQLESYDILSIQTEKKKNLN